MIYITVLKTQAVYIHKITNNTYEREYITIRWKIFANGNSLQAWPKEKHRADKSTGEK